MSPDGSLEVIATTRLDSRGRVTLPKVVWERLAMQPGDKLDWRIEHGKVVLGVIRYNESAKQSG